MTTPAVAHRSAVEGDKPRPCSHLGFESSEDYTTQDSYIGATIGRVAGRINSGRFKLDGKTYQVQTNTEAGHLTW